MKLMRVSRRGSEVPVVTLDGEVFLDARVVTDDYHPEFFSRGGLDDLRASVADATLPTLDVTGLRCAPVARPTAIICIGQNYAAHAAESGDEPPTIPIVFLKHPNTLRGAYDDVRVPLRAERTDWEVELAVAIGAEARYLQSRSSHWRASRGTPYPTTSQSGSFRPRWPVAGGPRANVARTSSRSAPGWPWTRSLSHRSWACAQGSTASRARTRTPPT
jgi:hypothetical protein